MSWTNPKQGWIFDQINTSLNSTLIIEVANFNTKKVINWTSVCRVQLSWKKLSLWWHVCQGLIKYHVFWLDCFWIGLELDHNINERYANDLKKTHHSLTKSCFHGNYYCNCSNYEHMQKHQKIWINWCTNWH